MTTYFAEHALLPTGDTSRVRITVHGDRITGIATRVRREPDDVVLPGVVLPGLANAHSHAFHRALRGRTHGQRGNFWSWREGMYAVAERLTPDTYLALARGVYAEMLLAGFTVVGEFHYLHHAPGGVRYADPNAMSAALTQAAEDVGIRLTLLDVCYLSGGLGPDGHLPLDPVQQRFGDGDVDGWARRVEQFTPQTPRVTIGAAAHSVRAVPEPALREFADVTTSRVVHAHVSEQPSENAACWAAYGRTPVRLLADTGLLTERFTAVHGTHLTDDDIAVLARPPATVCFCATTERDLADGIGPARRLADAGVRLSLGSDQHAVIDPFEEIRGLEMHERLDTGERVRFGPDELTSAASESGYASLGWPGAGTLVEGGLADFVAVRLDTVRTAGVRPGQVMYAATGADVADVVVGGRHVVRDGQHELGPVAPLLSEALDLIRDQQ